MADTRPAPTPAPEGGTTGTAGPVEEAGTAGPAAAVGTAGPATPARTPAAPRRRRGGLWWHRNFRLLWVGEGTSKLGSAVTVVSMPMVAIVTLHSGPLQVGMLEAAVWLPWLLIGLPAGALVDRMASRPIMMACNTLSATLLATVPLAAWGGFLTFGHLLLVALLLGVATVFFSTAYQVFLPSVVDRADLSEGNAKMQGTEAAAQVAGPGFGGLLVQVFGAVFGLVVNAATFVVSVLCLRRIDVHEDRAAKAPAAERSLIAEVREGLRFLVRDPYLRSVSAFCGANNLAASILQAVLVVFLVRTVGIGAGLVGVLLAVAGVGGVLGATLAPRLSRRFGSARALLLSVACTAPFTLLIPLTGKGWGLLFVVAGGMVSTSGIIAFNVVFGSFRPAYVPPHLLGRTVSAGRFVNYCAMPLGALAGGALGALAGPRTAVWTAAVCSVLSVLVLLAGPVRGRRDLPTSPS